MPTFEQLQLIDLEGLRQMKTLFSRDWPQYYLEYQIINSIISFKTTEPQMKNVWCYTLPDQRAQELGLFLILVSNGYFILNLNRL